MQRGAWVLEVYTHYFFLKTHEAFLTFAQRSPWVKMASTSQESCKQLKKVLKGMEDHVHDIFVTFHAASWTLILIDSIFISKHNIQHLEMYKEIGFF